MTGEFEPSSDTVERFREAISGSRFRLDAAALALADHCSPQGADVAGALASLDSLASRISEPTLDGVVRLLYRDEGFVGDREDYYNPDNSLLDRVLDRRRGIPISLAVLVIEVGRRAGVPLFGVGMPGHFLVGDRVDKEIFIDPFSGAVIGPDGAQSMFRRMQPGAPFQMSYLDETPPAHIVLRMLNNLRMIHQHQRDNRSLVRALELMICLEDCPSEEYRHLAAALDILGRTDEAARYLDQASERYEGPDSQRLASEATRLWARLN